MTNNNKEIEALQTERYSSLFEIAKSGPKNVPDSRGVEKGTPNRKGMSQNRQAAHLTQLPASEQILGLDIVTFIDSQFSERQKRQSTSARQLERDKQGLLNKGLIKEVWLGKSLFLAPMKELYQLLRMDCPYQRNTWSLHSFLVLLAEKLIEPNPLIKYTKREVSLGDANSTVDLISYFKNGQRWAWEIIHRCTTNIVGAAARLQGKAFSQVIFLTTDFNTKEKVWATLRNAGFAPDFFATIRCTIFSTLIRQRKQMKLKELT